MILYIYKRSRNMKFEKLIPSGEGKPVIHLNVEGLDFPDSEKWSKYLNFPADAYASLNKQKSDDGWNSVFRIPNEVLATMNEEDATSVAATFIMCNYHIKWEASKLLPAVSGNPIRDKANTDYNAGILLGLEHTLSKLILQLDQEINLLDKLEDYVKKNIPLDGFENVGMRPQDTSAKTFHLDGGIKLNVLSALAKLLCPIFSAFITEFMTFQVASSYREMHIRTLLNDILSEKNNPEMARIIDKLEYFIESTVEVQTKKIRPTILKKGLTLESLSQAIFATIIVKRLVTVDLFTRNVDNGKSNIMTYIDSCTKSAASSADSSGSGIAWEDRKLNDELSDGSDGDDGNSSILEQESSTSSKTADFRVMIEFAIEDLRKRFCVENDLDIDVINQSIVYYSTAKHLILDINNSYLLSIMFGKELCGARSVEMLSSKDLAILISMMQVYLISIGMKDLVHVLSLLNTGEPRSDKTGAEMDLMANWKNSIQANNCDARFPYSVNGITWCTSLKNLIDQLILKKYIYNTSPAIWEMLGEPSRNGQTFTAPANLATMICSFILQKTPEIEYGD